MREAPASKEIPLPDRESVCRQICEWVKSLARGESRRRPSFMSPYANQIVEAIASYHEQLQREQKHLELVDRFLVRLQEGRSLHELLDYIFNNFGDFVPFDRIGFSLIEEENPDIAVAIYMRLREGTPCLNVGYRADIRQSSLKWVLESGQPRIINNLEEYFLTHPHSVSTQLVLQEGIRSSLTVPLVAFGRAVGFLFFSSKQPNTYNDEHAALLLRLGRKLGIALEKANMMDRLFIRTEQVRQLANMASHDLRNGLSLIEGYLDVLEKGADPAVLGSREEIISRMRKACNEGMALVSDIMDLARADARCLRVRKSLVDLPSLVRERVEFHRVRLNLKHLSVHIESQELLPTLEADPILIGRVLDNLLSNAIKCAPPDSTINIVLSFDDNKCTVSVRDSGPGIALEAQKDLFTCFPRITRFGPQPEISSVGLGLAVAKELVMAHGGQIGVRSLPGEGSTFWFSLPRKGDVTPLTTAESG
ncbi:MAG: GAF domain-containing sensor histidine kinase [Candidatus Sumerlaeaceae bacterium]|nr:GAF domain-containing sensor histidine kinase [Candidatus Sumerlaeaceae bacterium]